MCPRKTQVAALRDMSFFQSADLIEVYDFLDVQIDVASPTLADIFDYIERCYNPRQGRRLDMQQQADRLLTQPSVISG